MSEDKSKDSIKQRFTQYLDTQKHRKTPERYAVLNIVYDTVGHFDVDYIYDEMLNSGIRVSRATVYNTLDLLVKSAFVRKFKIETKTYYERSFNAPVHVHLICTQCGKIKDARDTRLVDDISIRRYGKFSTSYCTVNIYGLCSSCTLVKRKAKLKANIIANESKVMEIKKRILSENKKNK
ncbi:MAG: Fur family transcriptional regulator [Bacteroidales bacterium]